VSSSLRALRGCVSALRGGIRTPADALLMIEMASFIAGLPLKVSRSDVPTFFRRLERSRRPRAKTLLSGYWRIARVRDACLTLPRLWRRDTCYVRALTLYRFLDGRGSTVRVHFGVEQPASRGERLRGHAWVSVDGRLFEGPDAVRQRRIQEVPLHVAH
jgi:hypothetical protein